MSIIQFNEKRQVVLCFVWKYKWDYGKRNCNRYVSNSIITKNNFVSLNKIEEAFLLCTPSNFERMMIGTKIGLYGDAKNMLTHQ